MRTSSVEPSSASRGRAPSVELRTTPALAPSGCRSSSYSLMMRWRATAVTTSRAPCAAGLAHPGDDGFVDVEGHAFLQAPAQQRESFIGAARQRIERQNENANDGIGNKQRERRAVARERDRRLCAGPSGRHRAASRWYRPAKPSRRRTAAVRLRAIPDGGPRRTSEPRPRAWRQFPRRAKDAAWR